MSLVIGWESQLLETGFLAIFACPVFSLRQIPVNTPLSAVVVWGYRWLIFRIMIGAVCQLAVDIGNLNFLWLSIGSNQNSR